LTAVLDGLAASVAAALAAALAAAPALEAALATFVAALAAALLRLVGTEAMVDETVAGLACRASRKGIFWWMGMVVGMGMLGGVG